MAAIGSTEQILFPDSYICKCADKFIACEAKRYIEYGRYKVGKEPDIRLALKVDKLRRLFCEEHCGLCPEEIERLKERMNRIIL